MNDSPVSVCFHLAAPQGLALLPLDAIDETVPSLPPCALRVLQGFQHGFLRQDALRFLHATLGAHNEYSQGDMA